MAIQGFFDLQIDLRDLSHFYRGSLKYCKVYNRSLYDASYLALAETERIPLITADKGLYNAVKKDLKWVKWIGEV